MTSIERNVKQTRFRLGLNSWFSAVGWCLVGAAVVWLIVVVLSRLLAFDWPVPIIGLGLIGLSCLTSLCWVAAKRRDDLEAAAILDEAAALKERTSTGLYCLGSDDPFAQAVAADAEAISSRISVRSFIRYDWPSSLSFASLAIVLALGLSLIPLHPLQSTQRNLTGLRSAEVLTRTEVRKVRRRLSTLQENAEKNPLLKDLESQLKTLDQLPQERLPSAQSTRREMIKKLDSMADALKQKQRGPQFDKMRELKKMFRGLKANKQPQTPADRLSQALAKGDFKSAQDALKDMKEQLAQLAEKQDPQKQEQIKKQLDTLSKKLSQAAKQQQRKQELQKEMEQQGLDQETAQKLLKDLTKEDIQQAMKEMQKKGMNQQQAKEMAKKMQACQKAGQQGGSMAQAMQQAAESMKASSMSEAAAQLDEVADQLNSMEALDQQLGEMSSTMADLQDMKNDLSGGPGQDEEDEESGNCSNCNGKGCSQCDGGQKNGQGGMGRLGQGRGGRADSESTRIRFLKKRTPVITTKGSLIAKMFVDGEQIRGDVGTEAVDLLAAAERDATDAITRNRIPNQYSEAVKQYFSDLVTEFSRTQMGSDAASSKTDTAEGENGSESQ